MIYFLRLTIFLLTVNSFILANNSLMSIVQEKYSKITTIQGKFIQNLCSEEQGTCQQFEGIFSAQKPSFSRLEVTKPEKQLIVSDTANLYYYLVNKKKVYVQSANTGINFFKIFDILLQDTAKFTMTGSDNKYAILQYKKDTLEQSNIFEDLKLSINNKTYLIEKFSFTDFTGSENEFILTNIKVNQNLSPKLFKFTIPKGVEVIKY